MAEQLILNAEMRDRAGKGAARATRKQGRVPGVVYGGKKKPEMVSFETRELLKAYNTGMFLRTLYHVDIDGKQTRVIPRDVQLHPVTDKPLHVDLLRLEKGAQIAIDVTVVFQNEEESPGLARGGVLNVVRHDVEMSVPVDNMPTEIFADLTGLDIGGSVHISDIPLPEGCTPTITDRDFTVATIAAPTIEVVVEEEEEDIEGLEGEEGVEGEEGAEAAEGAADADSGESEDKS